ncbi:MAG: hypothetical protein QM725_11915 [Lacibacter sp.]
MKKTKLILILLVSAAVIGSAYAWLFIWNKPQMNIENKEAVRIAAVDLFNEYSTNEANANATYIDKIVEVTGVVNSVSNNSEGKTVVMLKTNDEMFGVNCTLEKNVVIKEGETVSLKGICTGYLTDVVLIRCYKTK